MRFGAHYLPAYMPELDGTPPEYFERMFEQMALLDDLGFQHAWVTEHHLHEYGGLISHPPTFLAAVARGTRRLRLGVAVSILPLHHPLQVAEAYGMVDVISNGRLEFGVGRGNALPDYEAFGYSYPEGPARTREATEIIRDAWARDAVTYHGQFYDYDDVRVLPQPVQRPHPPIWFAASRSDDSFRWAGQQGFHLLTLPYMYNPQDLQQSVGLYRAALTEAGHDLASRELLGKFHIYVADSNRAVDEALPYLAHYETISHEGNVQSGRLITPGITRRVRESIARDIETGNIIAGDPDRCIEIIRRWRDTLGLTTVTGTFYFGGMPQEMALRNIRRFAEHVMPAFRDKSSGEPHPSTAEAALS
jgi:alkanesulfonate monooxygenase SsuD/methylene tetrahydromethanopterin reductase-like flavin-dependent oxidoreductase (luciferase family)